MCIYIHVYINICFIVSLWFTRTDMLVSSCSEKVLATICHTRFNEPMKQQRLIAHGEDYFTEITRLGDIPGIFGWLTDQKSSGNKVHSQMQFGNILLLYNNSICHLSLFKILNMKTGCPASTQLSIWATQCSSMLCGKRCCWEQVSSCLRQRGQQQQWERGRLRLFPLFNVSFIHLQDMGFPTLFQPHIKNRHTLLMWHRAFQSRKHALVQVCNS